MTDQQKRKTIDERANELLQAGQAKTKAEALLLARKEAAQAKADALKAESDEAAKKLKKIEATISREKAKAKNKDARRERTKRCIITGSLVEKAGMADWDQATLLGAFLQLAEVDDSMRKRFQARGEEAFEKGAAHKKAGEKEPTFSPATPRPAVPKAVPAPGHFYLHVPIEEKDEAKALGARWDSEQKKWWCNPADKEKFTKWFPKA
jgi:hypothetical protein